MPPFVPYVEPGTTRRPSARARAGDYLEPLNAARVDTVVLGCTHYPLLTGVIQLILGEDVTLVSSAEETAKDVYRVLIGGDLRATRPATPPEHNFLATGDPEPFGGSDGASSAPRSARCCARNRWAAA